METRLRADYESSVARLEEFMSASDKLDGASLLDVIDEVEDLIKSTDKVRQLLPATASSYTDLSPSHTSSRLHVRL
jgi:hypothetical protein